jgi:hypothetical protein
MDPSGTEDVMLELSDFARKTANTIAAAARLYFEPLVAHNLQTRGAGALENPRQRTASTSRSAVVWATGTACAVGLASFLSVSYVRLQSVSMAQRVQIASTEAELRRSAQHEQQLTEQVGQLQDLMGLATRGIPERNQREVPPAHTPSQGTGYLAVEALPVLELEPTRGIAESKLEDLRLSLPIPAARIRVHLGEVRNNAVIDVLIADDSRIERRNVPVEGQGVEKHITVTLTPAEVKMLLNRQVSLTATDRGHATIGTMMFTLRPE